MSILEQEGGKCADKKEKEEEEPESEYVLVEHGESSPARLAYVSTGVLAMGKLGSTACVVVGGTAAVCARGAGVAISAALSYGSFTWYWCQRPVPECGLEMDIL